MSNLLKLNTTPSDVYSWDQIEDTAARSVSQTAVTTYVQEWESLRQQADALLGKNTLAVAKCVYTLKQVLPHGQFLDVCEKTLKLNSDKAGSLASVQHAIMQGDVPAEALKLLDQMEPRAARRFVNSSPEAKVSYVAEFEQTGKVPSQRDFQSQTDPTPKPKVNEYKDETVNPIVEVTQNKWEAKDRFTAYKIRPVHAIEALVDMLSSQKELRPDVETALIALAKEAERLLGERRDAEGSDLY